jgi:hypothetical protein
LEHGTDLVHQIEADHIANEVLMGSFGQGSRSGNHTCYQSGK